MERRHKECYIDRCKICMEDHQKLFDYLEEISGVTKGQYDLLGMYRTFLDKKEVKSEGKDGWGNEIAFDDKNIEEFLSRYTKE